MAGNSGGGGGMGSWIGPAIGAVGGILGGTMAGGANRKTRKHQDKWNLINIDQSWKMWDATNAYNTPMEQRRRMELAGFNPNLAYGSGSIANTANQGNVADGKVIENTSGKDIGEGINQGLQNYANMTMQRAQLRDLEKNQEVKDAQIALTKAQELKTMTDTDTSKFNLGRDTELRDNYIQQQKEQLTKRQLDNAMTELRVAQMPEQHKTAIAEALQRIASMKNQMSATNVEKALKQEQLNLRRKGIEVTDPMWARLGNKLLGDKVEEGYNNVKERVKKTIKNYQNPERRKSAWKKALDFSWGN